MDKDNANPTILNVSELPTRQSRKRAVATSKDPGSELDFVLRRPEYLSAPFCDLSWTSDDTESDDGFTIEPIDEQEIYGRGFLFSFAALFNLFCYDIGCLLLRQPPTTDRAFRLVPSRVVPFRSVLLQTCLGTGTIASRSSIAITITHRHCMSQRYRYRHPLDTSTKILPTHDILDRYQILLFLINSRLSIFLRRARLVWLELLDSRPNAMSYS